MRFCLVAGLCAFTTAVFAAETLYVQPVKAAVKAQPKMDAPAVTELARGAEVEALSTQGLWIEVKAGSKKGFMSKIFLSKNKPVGGAELLKDVSVSAEKASRKRESGYNLVAAARGLQAGDRTRQGREEYRADSEAVLKMEKRVVTDSSVEAFIATGGLAP